jgi:exoribonuclease-2
LFEHFPRGTGFAADLRAAVPENLRLAESSAFSIDDSSTSEIDDAFSVRLLANGHTEVGIHIAAPALGIVPGSPLDEEAMRRQSTVYMPGSKITMLPEPVITQFTLAEGASRPALSLYVELDPELAIVGQRSVMELVPITANLRHETLEQEFNEASLASQRMDYPYASELTLLWRFARTLEVARGQSENGPSRPEYNFQVEGERVRITERRRGSPIDKVVSELMILVNRVWGGLLAEHQVNGIYRSQSGGKVRMSTVPARHEGLGVAQYAWSSSPLRRYVDLVNQRQLIALLRGELAPYDADRERLLVVMRDFEAAYDAYAEFQRHMERYWCLRWLQQEGVTESGAEVIRENLVRFDRIPLVLKVPSVPELAPGTRIRVEPGEADFLNVELPVRFAGLEAVESVP